MRLVAELVRTSGAEELVTSYVPGGEGGPWPFHEPLSFVPTGELDVNCEIIVSLDLRSR